MEWYPVENLLYGDIGDLKIEYFEDISRTQLNTPSQNEASTMEIYRSKTFCLVVDLIQQDMREALHGCSIDVLRKKYKEEYLFDPEVCKTIVDEDYAMEEEDNSLNLSGDAKPFSADSLIVEVMPNAVYYGRSHREQWTLEGEEVTLETIQNLCSDLFRNEIERLELFWTNTNEASECINSRSLILINHRYPKLFPKGTIGYTCYCFDHLLERKYTLISLPDVCKQANNEGIELLRSKFGRFPVYIIHKETNKLYPLLNKSIFDVSNLSKEIDTSFDLWDVDAYLNRNTEYYLDKYMEGGFPYTSVSDKISETFPIPYAPKFLKVKDFDGKVRTKDFKTDNKMDSSLDASTQVQLFVAGQLSRLRIEWVITHDMHGRAHQPYSIHLLLLNDGTRHVMIYFDDRSRQFNHLVFNVQSYMSDRRVKKVLFNQLKHDAYRLHHNMERIKEKLALMLPRIPEVEGMLEDMGEFTSYNEMKKGKSMLSYEEVQSLYFEM